MSSVLCFLLPLLYSSILSLYPRRHCMKQVFLVFLFMVPLLVVSSFSYAETDAKVDKQKADLAATKAKAEAGDPEAQVNLGVMYLDGDVVPRDVQQARYWFNKAAQGDPVRQYMIGEILSKTYRDYRLAHRWYEKAADQGHADAQYRTGVRYHGGQVAGTKIVGKNYLKAAQYFVKAADQGHAKAQYMLGEMYYKGEGVPKALDKALEWFRKAADQGHFNAQAMLRLLE